RLLRPDPHPHPPAPAGGAAPCGRARVGDAGADRARVGRDRRAGARVPGRAPLRIAGGPRSVLATGRAASAILAGMNIEQAASSPATDAPVLDIVLAEPRGFCAGVERAIEIVERAIAKYGAPVYVRHEIVHNRHVVQ